MSPHFRLSPHFLFDIFPNLSPLRVIHLNIDSTHAYLSIRNQNAVSFRRRKHHASTFGIR